MSKLELDPISARTLPRLDALYRDGGEEALDKLVDMLMATPPEPLRRLTLAALSRLSYPLTLALDAPESTLIQGMVDLNLEDKAESISFLLDRIGLPAEVSILGAVIAIYSNSSQQGE
jgi:hypothetical protein